MKLVPDGAKLLEKSGLANAHQLSLKARASYPTVEKYVNRPESLVSMDCAVLAALLLDGLELKQDQALDLRLGDIFKFID